MSSMKLSREKFDRQDNIKALEAYGLSKEVLQTLSLVTESLALAKYIKTPLQSFYEDDEFDKDVYFLGSAQCLDLLIEKLERLFESIKIG